MINLETHFADVLTREFPLEAKKGKTFLDIAQMPHYENVNSNILTFFLDQNEEHGFKDLFVTSLLELASSHKELSLLDWTVEREITTKQGKRIDIEIQSSDKDKVIIIENKIYHWLANDLNDYWQHYPNINSSNKIGIVLSMYAINVKDVRYINITHQQLCKQVLKNLGAYLLHGNTKYIVYLKDYIENINSFYMSNERKAKLEFYFENIDKVNELLNIKDDATTYILNQVTVVGEALGLPVRAKRKNDRRYFPFPEFKDDKLYYAIFVEHLFSSRATFKIIIEGHKIAYPVQQHIIDNISDKYHHLQHVDEPQPYIHFLKKTYHFDPKDTANFSKVILEILERDFDAARKKITQLLLEKIYA